MNNETGVMSLSVGVLIRYSAVILALLGFAYGYGQLNSRVESVGARLDLLIETVSKGQGNEPAINERLADTSARLAALEREMSRLRDTIERQFRLRSNDRPPDGPAR